MLNEPETSNIGEATTFGDRFPWLQQFSIFRIILLIITSFNLRNMRTKNREVKQCILVHTLSLEKSQAESSALSTVRLTFRFVILPLLIGSRQEQINIHNDKVTSDTSTWEIFPNLPCYTWTMKRHQDFVLWSIHQTWYEDHQRMTGGHCRDWRPCWLRISLKDKRFGLNKQYF